MLQILKWHRVISVEEAEDSIKFSKQPTNFCSLPDDDDKPSKLEENEAK